MIYPDDGGCDEGPSYWGRAGASLYQNLDLLKRATNGKFDVFDNQLIKNMGSYIYKAYIEYPYFINFADADATTGSRPANYLQLRKRYWRSNYAEVWGFSG